MQAADKKGGMAIDGAMKEVLALLRARLPGLIGVWLFGSCARGEARDGSDVDLAVLTQAPLRAAELWQLAQVLAGRLGREVDLVDLRAASAVLRMQAVGRGRRIFCADHKACEAFEDFVFSDYARLNEERAGILADRLAAHG